MPLQPDSEQPFWRGYEGIIALTAAYLLAATIGAIVTANLEFIFYIVVMLILLVAVVAVHLRVHFSKWVLWALCLWGLAHMAGGLLPVPEGWPINGEIRVLYSLWIVPNYLKYDQLVHAYGFFVTTWVCWEALRSHLAARLDQASSSIQPSLGVAILCGMASMGFGAMNEVVEFTATVLVPETNVGGYANTGWDLVANTVGASLAVVTLIAFARRQG